MRGLVFALVLAGCFESDAQRANEVCNVFCDCASGTHGTGGLEQCIDTCLTHVREPVPDACVSCVQGHESTCSFLISSCETLCIAPSPPQGTP